jgi:CheY-like chemotaxis protein
MNPTELNPIAMNPILLVDDSAEDVQLILSALKRASLKNEVIALRDGSEALDYLYRQGNFTDRRDPIVILLDIKMPKVTGLEVLERIKTDEKLKNIPVVMLTSSNQRSDIDKSYDLGTNAYVVKPVAFAHLVEAIRYLGVFWTAVNQPPILEAI